MNKEEIITKVKEYKWQPWLNRPFDSAFIVSLFWHGITKEASKRTGIPISCKAIVYERKHWLESKEVWEEMAKDAVVYLKTRTMFDATAELDNYYSKSKKRLLELAKEEGNELEQLEEVREIISTITSFIWLTHGIEEYFDQRVKSEVPKHVQYVDTFIRNTTHPVKKTAQERMEHAIREGKNVENIAKEFGWIKVRDGFSEPFSVEEIEELKKIIKKPEHPEQASVPEPLQDLIAQLKELVYFRTHRTDVFYEFLYLARPVLQRVAQHYNMDFKELRHYPIETLLSGKPEKYTGDYTMICYEGNATFLRKPLFVTEQDTNLSEVKGMIAQPGKVTGKVKIVQSLKDINKVKEGDILVTQMTFPSFITAMHRAVAFVTDEGGITCHAAIVSREMKKPCIIGTKIATKVFKDGDLVEVDANNGTVKKL
jgi:phosphohistidine swiveling domain-containing protein